MGDCLIEVTAWTGFTTFWFIFILQDTYMGRCVDHWCRYVYLLIPGECRAKKTRSLLWCSYSIYGCNVLLYCKSLRSGVNTTATCFMQWSSPTVVKPVHAVTSIKQSPIIKGHHRFVLS
jgi:hypothetical protein